MPSRRSFLKSLGPIAATVAIPVIARPEQPKDDCEFFAQRLAEAMQKRHGGRPLVTLDHDIAVAQVIIT